MSYQKQLREMGFDKTQVKTYVGYILEYQASKMSVGEHFMTIVNNSEKRSFFMDIFKKLTYEAEPRWKVQMTKTERYEYNRFVDMKYEMKQGSQTQSAPKPKTEKIDFDYSKYTPLLNQNHFSPCTGCIKDEYQCEPGNCQSLSLFIS